MIRIAIVGVTLLLLVALLGGSTYASYRGVGIVDLGSPSARQGSIFGPNFFGGGPGSGK